MKKKAGGTEIRIFISCCLCFLLSSWFLLSPAGAETYVYPPSECKAELDGNAGVWQTGVIKVYWKNNSYEDYETVLDKKESFGWYTEKFFPHGTAVYTDNSQNIKPGTSYCYRVAARIKGTANNTAWSNEACLVTPALPPAPTNLKASTVSDPSPRVILSWNGTPGAAGYRIESKEGNSNFKEAGRVLQGVNTYSQTGNPNTDYRYRVSTYAFFRSAPVEVAIKTGAAIQKPPMPANLTTKALPYGVQVSWQNPVAYDELVLLRRKEGEPNRTSIAVSYPETSYTDTGLIPEMTYYYRILGKKKYPNGALSSDETAETKVVCPPATPVQHYVMPPAKPQIVDLKPSATGVILSWKIPMTEGGSKDIKTFRIERKKTDGAFVQVAEVPPNASTPGGSYTFTDTALTPETTYIYRIRSHNDQGDSLYSPEATAKTLPDLMRKQPASKPAIPGGIKSR
jgi:hypothetical protein